MTRYTGRPMTTRLLHHPPNLQHHQTHPANSSFNSPPLIYFESPFQMCLLFSHLTLHQDDLVSCLLFQRMMIHQDMKKLCTFHYSLMSPLMASAMSPRRRMCPPAKYLIELFGRPSLLRQNLKTKQGPIHTPWAHIYPLDFLKLIIVIVLPHHDGWNIFRILIETALQSMIIQGILQTWRSQESKSFYWRICQN